MTSGFLVSTLHSVLFVFVEDQSPISSTGLFESKLRKSHSLYRIPIKLLNKDGDF